MVNFELGVFFVPCSVMLINSPFTFYYRAQNSPSLLTYHKRLCLTTFPNTLTTWCTAEHFLELWGVWKHVQTRSVWMFEDNGDLMSTLIQFWSSLSHAILFSWGRVCCYTHALNSGLYCSLCSHSFIRLSRIVVIQVINIALVSFSDTQIVQYLWN